MLLADIILGQCHWQPNGDQGVNATLYVNINSTL